jgi:hypothetical protein
MKRIFAVLGAIGGILLIAYLVYGSIYIYDRDVIKQQRIADAYIAFYNVRHVFPSSLTELVLSGQLPARGAYKEPPGIFSRDIAYTDGDYQVFPPKDHDPSTLTMLGRKGTDGRWDFNPPINAGIRDGIRK